MGLPLTGLWRGGSRGSRRFPQGGTRTRVAPGAVKDDRGWKGGCPRWRALLVPRQIDFGVLVYSRPCCLSLLPLLRLFHILSMLFPFKPWCLYSRLALGEYPSQHWGHSWVASAADLPEPCEGGHGRPRAADCCSWKVLCKSSGTILSFPLLQMRQLGLGVVSR